MPSRQPPTSLPSERFAVDVAVVGGGLVGSAIAWGALEAGATVALLDEGDVAHRASRGNFGQIWVQGKGEGHPPYARLTQRSATLWPEFSARLGVRTGIDVGFSQPGGLTLCLSEEELATRAAIASRLDAEGGSAGMAILDRDAVARMTPLPLGDSVRGASFCPADAHANPLALLRAFHLDIQAQGGAFIPHTSVEAVRAVRGGFAIATSAGEIVAGKVVVAAGLGSAGLAASLGLDMPVRPVRGQVMVTERAAPLGDFLFTGLRQTREGSLMIGGTQEEVGFDDGTANVAMRTMSRRAVASFPDIARLDVVRCWGALRIMTPDGRPIYQQSRRYPGAFAATCHSGVTLAAAHALVVAPSIVAGDLPHELATFSADRFHVQAA
ncbi:NAD(P)/FAD-dependent oxidoreductase [Acuticoccus mangrovi]|uniref:FAD-binding oxidoreductase n=1 Tax=Acuticoccus mangrovi TaxID=2796142 RepID=A0A934IND4_9HYPH|nr:FAD-dependent oxidoreductase [Acuticoccus mangrovi]MBJ3775641.1 FAD-binding oxidoreductase [Acuticoccus mangrovi]